MHWFYENGYSMGGMHGLWWIFWVVLVVALVFIAVARPQGRNRPSRESPHEILRRRLANGDISEDQYEELKKLLDRDKGIAG
jgi:putative membrane protein